MFVDVATNGSIFLWNIMSFLECLSPKGVALNPQVKWMVVRLGERILWQVMYLISYESSCVCQSMNKNRR